VLARLSRLSPARFVFSPSGRHLVVAPTQGAAALWDTGQGKRVAFLEQRPQSRADAIAAKARRREVQSPRGQQTLSQVVFDADGQRVATIAADDTASLWEVVDGAHRELGMALASVEPRFSPDGRLLAAALRDQAVAVWRVPGDREPAIVGLSAPASHLLFSPDSAQLAIATTDGCVYLERVRPSDGAVTEEMTLSLGQAAAELLFDRNGVRLAIRSANGEACLWSTRTGARMAELSQPTAVDRLVFSADGSRLATAHRDHTVRCWDARSGHAVVTLPGTAPVEALAFSPSGQRLTLVSTDAQHAIVLKAWDLRTDRARLVETLDRAKSKSAIVHMSGRWLAYGDEHLAHIWDLEQSRDITAVYADFDDPSVQATDWRLVTSDDPTHVQVGNHQPAVRLARGPYLWIISALDGQATKAAIQVLDAEHLYQIDATLAERRLVTSRHHIEGPIYTDVAIPLTVVRRSPAINPARVVKEIQDALTRFFDPLHGGPDGTGWPLGRPVYASEVYDVVEGVASVDHVTATKALRDTPISARSLVAFDIQVTVE
jgi:WD40 repeat protein